MIIDLQASKAACPNPPSLGRGRVGAKRLGALVCSATDRHDCHHPTGPGGTHGSCQKGLPKFGAFGPVGTSVHWYQSGGRAANLFPIYLQLTPLQLFSSSVSSGLSAETCISKSEAGDVLKKCYSIFVSQCEFREVLFVL